MRLIRFVALLALILGGLPVTTPVVAAAPATCQFTTPDGTPSPIKHVVHIQFDNVHFSRDNPNVPSDLEQMPNLLNFIENNGTLLGNEHTPLISHTAHDLVTGITGVYGNESGIPGNNSFEYYNNSSVGAYNTSAFAYWTDTVAPDPANPSRTLPPQMIDSAGKTLPAPWVPYVNAGCNFGGVSSVNMVLENNTNDITQVFGAGSPESQESSADRTKDFVGIAVHCADNACSSVGNGSGTGKHEPGGQGIAALFGHKNVSAALGVINHLDGTPINGFEGFDPTPNYTLGYMAALLAANVPVVYGYIADAHDSRNSCAPTSASNPVVADTNNGKPCGAYAPGEPGYVQQLKDYDTQFGQFFQKLDAMGIGPSNTVFVFHSDENDHYGGSAPTNPGCDGVHVACKYDRTTLGEITTDLPLLLKQKGLYDFAMFGGTGSTPGTPRPGFSNTDTPYAIDFDTAPGFWLKGHPANGSATLRKLEGALGTVQAPDRRGHNEPLFNFLVDLPGLKALHMVTADNDRTPGVVGFGQEDHFIQTSALISSSGTSGCNRFPATTDTTCLSNGFIWLHGDVDDDITHTWAALVGPGVRHVGVDSSTWADHSDLRPTLMTLLCLRDSYTYEGRALLEDIQRSALPRSVAAHRSELIELGRAYKQLNAPVGVFGKTIIALNTRAIRSGDDTYARLEAQIQSVTAERDAIAAEMQAVLGQVPGCGGLGRAEDGALRGRAEQVLARLGEGNEDSER
ncbi:MAG: hypothetical protein JO020_02220 [Chloroflexi bacterium]|nr:hypothetical protein [Chloroflexota bacterium]